VPQQGADGTGPTLLIDTVGFIRKLPHQLVASFRSTLEEVLEADLLLLVADSHSEALDDQLRVVREVLREIGAGDVPQQLVLNQIDRLDEEALLPLRALHPEALLVSATTGRGIPELLDFLSVQKQAWTRRALLDREQAQERAAERWEQPEAPAEPG
jgi:50S ribosomal subunit-associated GTPase HflX